VEAVVQEIMLYPRPTVILPKMMKTTPSPMLQEKMKTIGPCSPSSPLLI
jgi:hypothetical protein